MIELSGVCGGYHGHAVVNDATISYEMGRITAIVGPNGCGKTTLLALSCGQLGTLGGSITLNGQLLTQWSKTDIAKHVSYLPQTRVMPQITVGVLVLHGRFPWLGYPRVYRKEDRAIAQSSMERMGIYGLRDKLMSELSGGQRQKAYIAMTLAQGSDTVLLDEPSVYLDIAHQLELADIMRSLRDSGRAVVAVLHDLNMALACADTIAVMQSGHIIDIGAPDAVLASGAIERAFGVKVSEKQLLGFTL